MKLSECASKRFSVFDYFLNFINAQGPQVVPRVTKNDVVFAKQLVKKT